MADLSVRAAATPDVLDRVQDELDLLWDREPGVRAEDRRRFEAGLVEVLGNVVEHGCAQVRGRLSVDVDVTPRTLTAVLGDDGPWAEVDLDEATLPDAQAESGRGLALAQASLDHLSHDRVGTGNRWTLRCDRP